MTIHQLIGRPLAKRTAARFAREHLSEKAGDGLVSTALCPVQFKLGRRPLAPGLARLPSSGSNRHA